VGGLDLEHGTLCVVGADESGIYLLKHPESDRFSWNIKGGHRVFRRDLLIPWKAFSYRAGKVLFKECLWLEMPSRRIYLHVPKDVGEKLLEDARRDYPV
jgi:hypothetical protein